MSQSKAKGTILFIIGLLCVGILILLFLAVGPPNLLAKSNTPLYCSSCHVMQSQYEAWFHSGAHRRILCVDCHLPHENAFLHYTWKALDGFKDMVVFYSGTVPERITISSHGKKVLQSNCIRCHELAVSMIDRERKCWECHKRITHQLTGTIETL